MKCRFFDECGYQRQMRGERADVWIVAGDMLFHTQDVFGEPAAVIIDEAIWKKGIRGIEGQEWVVAIDSLLGPKPSSTTTSACATPTATRWARRCRSSRTAASGGSPSPRFF